MNAVLEIDLEARVRAVVFADDFVDACRTVTLSRFCIVRQVPADRNAQIRKLQMGRLAFFVIGEAEADSGQAFKGQDAVRLVG